MSKRIKKIFVDMDGVLADFKKKWDELYGQGQYEKFDRSRFNDFVSNHEFAVLDLMPDAESLIKYLDEKWNHVPIEILSSTANENHSETISQQKRTWLNRHDIGWKGNFVPGKKYKYTYAEPGYVLIDDDKQNIEDWSKAGGIGILHRDAMTTIALLKLYV